MIDFIYAYLLAGLGMMLPISVKTRGEDDGNVSKFAGYLIAVLIWPIIMIILVKNGEIE